MNDKLEKAKEFLGEKWVLHSSHKVKRLPAKKVEKSVLAKFMAKRHG